MRWTDNMSLTHTPLTNEQKVLPQGAVIPSGESNFYDTAQNFGNHAGSGIDVIYTNTGSGVIATYRTTGITQDTSGIFSPSGLTIPFSNSQDVALRQIDDFTIFNNYIHYETGINGAFVSIPYISTYTVSLKFDPYKPIAQTISITR